MDDPEPPAGGMHAFGNDAFGSLTLRAGCAEFAPLHRRYPGVIFSSVKVWSTARRYLLDQESAVDIVDVRLNVRGAAQDLMHYRFMHPTWLASSAPGFRRHRTEAFGTADVHVLKNGQYDLRWASLDHALDLLSPALVPLYWTPAVR